jgi:hypothetical protein
LGAAETARRGGVQRATLFTLIRMTRAAARLGGLLLLCVWVACSSAARAPGVPDDPGTEGTYDTPRSGGAGGRDAGASEPIDCENSSGKQDADGDGFSRAAGDCDDCESARGPGALDLPENGVDEDCDGEDSMKAAPACDGLLMADSSDPEHAANALGICARETRASNLPGLIEATWSRLDGGTKLGDGRQVWLSERFGTLAAREGRRLLVLSTGVARDLRDSAYTPDCDSLGVVHASEGWVGGATPPEGYPRDESRCPKGTGSGSTAPKAFNDVVLELTLRAPSNARSFSFDSFFFTQEYPDFVCSPYNDFFVVFVDPAPAGHDDGNVLFDSEGDTIGVNTGLLAVCKEASGGRVTREVPCEAGPDLLKDTGFGAGESRCASKFTTDRDLGGAGTGWLHTDVPVKPGKLVTLRFVLWDSQDPLLDSTVLLDNFQWSLEAPQIGTRPISSR